MKHIIYFVIGIFMLQTVTAANAVDKIYNAKTMTLPNAMQVVVVENHRTPAVTHMVWYKIGGADEVIGESGLAHYLEHLMFKGTELVESGEFSKKVKSWGGNDNAFTSWDFTAYFQTVPKERLRGVMLMEADRMRNLNFSDEEALVERDVVIQERKQRTDSNPSAQLGEAMRAALFVNHPYARPIIGWDHELQKLTPESAREFYNKYYAPKNAVLVVSGDVKAKEVFELAAEIYGDIDNDGAITRPDWPDVPRLYGHTLVTHSHPSIKQPVWRKLFRVPGAGQNYETALTFALADEIIGGTTGRLYQSLVVEEKLASASSFSYGGIAVEDSTVSVGVTPLDGIASSQIDEAVNMILENIAENGVTDEEVNSAIARLQDQSVYERDSLTGPAMMVGYQMVSGLPLERVESWARDLEKVEPTDIQEAVQTYLLPSSPKYHAVTGHLVPEAD
jgi:zinc protease